MHCRAALRHLSTRSAILAAEVAVLGPGGPIVTRLVRAIGKIVTPAQRRWQRIRRALLVVMALRWHDMRARHKRARRAAATAALRSLDNAALRSLFQSFGVPEWAMMKVDYQAFGTRERVAWLNALLQSLWPQLSRCIQSVLIEEVQPLLDGVSKVFQLTIATFTLGNVAPSIDAVQVLSTDDDNAIKLRMDVTWRGDPNIVFTVSGAGVVGISVEVVNLIVQGTIEVCMKPLLTELPGVGGIGIMFTHEPYIKYDVRVKAAPGTPLVRLESVPGLNSLILHLLGTIIRKEMVFPHTCVIPLDMENEDAIRRDLSYSQIGSLTLVVKRARGLNNSDIGSLSDPYVRVAPMPVSKHEPAYLSRRSARYVTSVIRNNLDPVWMETCDIPVHDFSREVLALRIYDKDVASKDDLLGQVDIPMSMLCASANVTESSRWFRLFGPANAYAKSSFGDIEIAYTWNLFRTDDGGAGREAQTQQTQPISMIVPPSPSSSSSLSSPQSRSGIFARAVERVLQKTKRRSMTRRSETSTVLRRQRTERTTRSRIMTRNTEYEASGMSTDEGNSDDDEDVASVMPIRQLLLQIPGAAPPIWTLDSGIERTNFLNTIIAKVWPTASGLIRTEIEILKASGALSRLIPGLQLDVRNVSLGSLPPMLNGIRFIKFGKNSIALDLYVCVAGDMQASLGLTTFGNPMSRCQVTLQEAQFFATLRINMAPLLPVPPIIGGTTIQLLELRPNAIDASVVLQLSPLFPLPIDLLNLPVLRPMVLYALHALTRRMMLWPRSVRLPVLNLKHPSVRKHLESSSEQFQGAVSVRVLRARNLPNLDANSLTDAYAVVNIESLMSRKHRTLGNYMSRIHRTKVVLNSLHPVWSAQEQEDQSPPLEGGTSAKTLCERIDKLSVVVGVFDSDFRGGNRLLAKNILRHQERDGNLQSLNRATVSSLSKRQRRDVKGFKDIVPESCRKCALLDQQTEARIIDVQWSPLMLRMIGMVKAYMRLRRQGVDRLAGRCSSMSETPEETSESQSGGDILEEKKETALKRERDGEDTSGDDSQVRSTTVLDEMIDVECGIKGNALVGASVLDGTAIAQLLYGRDVASVWLPLEGAGDDAAVHLSFEWISKADTCPLFDDETNKSDIGEEEEGIDGEEDVDSENVSSAARALPRALSSPLLPPAGRTNAATPNVTWHLRPRLGFLVVDILHASHLPLPRRRLRVRESSRLVPFIQVRFAGMTRWSSCSRGCSPNFDERLEFADVTAATGDYIDVSIRHGNLQRSVRLGYVRVSFDDVQRAAESGLKSTWSLRESISGSLTMSFFWVPFASSSSSFSQL